MGKMGIALHRDLLKRNKGNLLTSVSESLSPSRYPPRPAFFTLNKILNMHYGRIFLGFFVLVACPLSK